MDNVYDPVTRKTYVPVLSLPPELQDVGKRIVRRGIQAARRREGVPIEPAPHPQIWCGHEQVDIYTDENGVPCCRACEAQP